MEVSVLSYLRTFELMVEILERVEGDRRRNAFWLVGLLSFANAVSLIDDRPLFELALFIYPLDIAGGLLIGLALKNILVSGRNPNLIEILVWAILGYSFIKFAQGALSFGTAAGVEYRQDFTVLATALYLSTVPFRRNPQEIVKLLSIVAFGYVVVALGRKLGLVEQTRSAAAALANDYLSHRLLPADGALFFALVGIAALVLFFRGTSPREPNPNKFFWGAIAAAALAAAAFSFHRSVWGAMAIGLTVFLLAGLRWSLFPGGYHRVLILFVIVFDVIVGFVVLGDDRVFGTAISEAFDEGSTIRWRIVGWEALIAKMSPIDYISGMKYGADTSRAVFGQIINNSAHNFYLGVFWVSGVVGALLYALLYLLIVIYLYPFLRERQKWDDKTTAFILLLGIVMIQVYFVVYSHWIFASIVLGYSMGFLRQGTVQHAARYTTQLDAPNRDTRLRY